MNRATITPSSSKRRVLYVTDFHEEEVLLGIADFARQANWELIANMRFHGGFPTEKEADGLLVTSYSRRVQKWLEHWKGTPIVHLGIPPDGLHFPSVHPDFGQAGSIGARHLMELGSVQHAFYTLEPGPDSMRIRDAFEKELAAGGLDCIRIELTFSSSLSPARDARLRMLARCLERLKKPVAIMTCDDRRSLELLEACELQGLRVPEDIAILGCENRRVEMSIAKVALSSIDFDKRRVGRKAAEILQSMMEGADPPSREELVPPACVIGRASTATFATAHDGIRGSILHIRGHYAEPMRLADLARLAGMSERLFRDEFKECVGHGPKEEILRVRIEAACRLLRDTDLKLEAVALESGFGSAKKLCEAFARHRGTSPGRWREQALEGKSSIVSG